MSFSRRGASVALAGVLATCLTPTARAQESYRDAAPEFSLGIGYANVSLGDSSIIDGENALRFEPVLSFSPIHQLPQLRIGAAAGVSMVLDNSTRTIVSGDNGLIYRGSSDVPLWLLEPELRIAWRQYLGEPRVFFIEPGAGAGYAFGFLELDDDDDDFTDSYDADDSTLFYRVFMRAGARVTGGMAGIEASWLAGDRLDFGGNASGDLSEFYIGVFGSISF
jgi:hypothetical protein